MPSYYLLIIFATYLCFHEKKTLHIINIKVSCFWTKQLLENRNNNNNFIDQSFRPQQWSQQDSKYFRSLFFAKRKLLISICRNEILLQLRRRLMMFFLRTNVTVVAGITQVAIISHSTTTGGRLKSRKLFSLSLLFRSWS